MKHANSIASLALTMFTCAAHLRWIRLYTVRNLSTESVSARAPGETPAFSRARARESRDCDGHTAARLLSSFLRREEKAFWTKFVKWGKSGTSGFQSSRITAESTFGRGVNAPGGTVKPHVGAA